MLPFSEIFHNFILPAVVVGVLLLAAWWPWRARWDGRWIGAIALAAGFAAAACAITGAPRWPPGSGDVSAWLIWFTLPVAVLGVADALLRPPNWLRAGILLILSMIGARLIIAPVTAHMPGNDLWMNEIWVEGFGLAVVLWWLALEMLAEHTRRATFPIIMCIIAAGFAGVLGTNASVKGSEAAVALAGMAVAAAVVGWIVPDFSMGRGAVLAFVAPLMGSLAVAHYYSYSDPPADCIALLLIAPLAAWGADLPGIRRMKRTRVILRIVLVLLAVGSAVGLSVRHSTPSNHAGMSSSNSEDD